MSGRFVTADGRGLAYEDTGGPGFPVLCLAGLTRNARDFAPLARHLSPRYRVIRLDSRGRGGSDRAADPEAEYTVPVEIGDALALVDHLGLERLAVIGTSRGGILGMGMAASRPDVVAALVLNDVGACVPTAPLVDIAEAALSAPMGTSFESAADGLAAAFGGSFPGVPLCRWQAHAEAIYAPGPGGRPVLSYDPEVVRRMEAQLADAGESVDLWPLFEQIANVPVLLLRGENSQLLTREIMAEMAERHPALEAVEIPDRGHAPFLDEPAALGAIDAFLEAHAK